MTKSAWSEKGLFDFILPDHSQSLSRVRTCTQAGLERGGRSLCRGHGGMLITGLLLLTSLACFLIELRTSSPALHLPHQSPTKKILYMMDVPQTKLIGAFSQGFLLLDDCSLYQIYINLASTVDCHSLLGWGLTVFPLWQVYCVIQATFGKSCSQGFMGGALWILLGDTNS